VLDTIGEASVPSGTRRVDDHAFSEWSKFCGKISVSLWRRSVGDRTPLDGTRNQAFLVRSVCGANAGCSPDHTLLQLQNPKLPWPCSLGLGGCTNARGSRWYRHRSRLPCCRHFSEVKLLNMVSSRFWPVAKHRSILACCLRFLQYPVVPPSVRGDWIGATPFS
jgi:hypothetical protein